MSGSRVRFPDGAGGTVSGAIAGDADTVIVLAHGAGTDMDHAFMVAVADGLAARGYTTVRFNFPYTERRGRAPDRAPALEACYAAVLDRLRTDLRPRRLVIGGKSMGGRMASHLAARGAAVDGLIFLGYPLHPAGRPEKLRDAHLPRITAPMLFLTGTRDTLCELDLLRPVLARCPTATLHVIDDGDHSFAVRKSSGRGPAEVMAELIETSDAWIHSLQASPDPKT